MSLKKLNASLLMKNNQILIFNNYNSKVTSEILNTYNFKVKSKAKNGLCWQLTAF